MIDTGKEKEKVFLVAAAARDHVEEAYGLLDELERLAETAEAAVAGRMVQLLPHPDPGTYLGKGKAEEAGKLARSLGADVILADDELTPGQMYGLEQASGMPVIDRTMVILDIFARHAGTRESMIQVELAELEYASSRLTGHGKMLSRQGGGIGTRGPGEKKLEQDRRLIRKRIAVLRRELADVEAHRKEMRSRRERAGMHHAAIVGYTNAGKSTLLNRLTGSGVLAENKLFATLDTFTRMFVLPEGEKMLLTDTVGFIRKLPHHLIKAFRSTLEEARYADVLIHVVDASSPEREEEMQTVYETLDRLELGARRVLTLFNKMDAAADGEILHDRRADETLRISAVEGTGLDQIPLRLQKLFREDRVPVEGLFSYREMELLQMLRSEGEMILEDYRDNGIYVKAMADRHTAGRVIKMHGETAGREDTMRA